LILKGYGGGVGNILIERGLNGGYYNFVIIIGFPGWWGGG